MLDTIYALIIIKRAMAIIKYTNSSLIILMIKSTTKNL